MNAHIYIVVLIVCTWILSSIPTATSSSIYRSTISRLQTRIKYELDPRIRGYRPTSLEDDPIDVLFRLASTRRREGENEGDANGIIYMYICIYIVQIYCLYLEFYGVNINVYIRSWKLRYEI